MKNNNLLIPFINLGHALDHLVMLIFPTVVLALSRDLNRPYAELLPLSLGCWQMEGEQERARQQWPCWPRAQGAVTVFVSIKIRVRVSVRV